MVDFYNILRHHSPDGHSVKGMWGGKQLPRLLRRYHEDPLSALMNGPIKQQLNIPQKVVWGGEIVLDSVIHLLWPQGGLNLEWVHIDMALPYY